MTARFVNFAVLPALEAINSWPPPRPPKQKAPTEVRAKIKTGLVAARRHPGAFAFVRVNRNQECIPIGIGEIVSLHVGAVVEGAI
jgi:hypothetical protein